MMSKHYDNKLEMYVPKKISHHKHNIFAKGHNNFSSFLRRYLHFRIQKHVEPYLKYFLLMLIVGLILNYVYYHVISINYLFIGGLNQWFRVLSSTLNYGIGSGYSLLYLVINGIFYANFYYSFIMIIYNTIINLDKKDTWIMLGWLALIIMIVTYLFPQII